MDDPAVPGAPLKPSRRALEAVGFVIGLAAVGFVASRLYTYAGQIDLRRIGATTWLSLAGLVLISGAANALLGRAWRELLAQSGYEAPVVWAVRLHGVSQVGKYVPGNVFQFAGRQALGMAAGAPSGPLARSIVWELGLLAVLGAIWSLSALTLFVPSVPVVVPSALVLAVALAGARQRWGMLVVRAALWQSAFLIVYGSLFVVVVSLVQGATLAWPEAPQVFGAFVLAWLVGLVTPGAPAGGGIREAILLFLLGAHIAPANLLLAVVLGRGVNVLGDLGFFAVASLLPKTELRDGP